MVDLCELPAGYSRLVSHTLVDFIAVFELSVVLISTTISPPTLFLSPPHESQSLSSCVISALKPWGCNNCLLPVTKLYNTSLPLIHANTYWKLQGQQLTCTWLLSFLNFVIPPSLYIRGLRYYLNKVLLVSTEMATLKMRVLLFLFFLFLIKSKKKKQWTGIVKGGMSFGALSRLHQRLWRKK